MANMLNLNDQLIIDGFHRFDTGGFTFHYRGLLFWPGYQAGEESLKAVVEQLPDRSFAQICGQLKGIFGIVLIDNTAGVALAATDPFGLYKLFYDGSTISNSFKQLVQRRGSQNCTIDDERLVEFLAHGSVYDRNTFVQEVQKIKAGEVIELKKGANGTWQTCRLEKQSIEPELDASAEFERYFSFLDTALTGQKMSADITGGLDTRINLAMLMTTKLDFELALSGRPGSIDLEIGKEVAETAGKSMFQTGHDTRDIEDAVLECYEHGDWQTDPLRFHRLMQLDRDRLARGINLICHGGGGELFKDFLWLQDFPLLGTIPPNYERFYALRVAPMSCRDALSDQGKQLLNDVRTRTIEKFKALNVKDNVTGYLMAVIHYRGIEFYGRVFTNHINLGINVLAPLLDRSNVLAGTRLPVRARLMNAWHRKMIDRHAPKIAEIRSTEGYATTYGVRFIGQVPGYLMMQGRRILRKSAQKLFGKNMFLEIGAAANDDKSMITSIRQSRHVQRAVELLQQRGILRAGITVEDLRDLHVGRVLAAGLFLERLEALDGHGNSLPASEIEALQE